MYINFLKSDFATGAGQKRSVCRHKKIIQNKREKCVHINYGIYNNKKKHKERERCKMFFFGIFFCPPNGYKWGQDGKTSNHFRGIFSPFWASPNWVRGRFLMPP